MTCFGHNLCFIVYILWTNDVTKETIRKCFEKADSLIKMSKNVDLPVIPCTNEVKNLWIILKSLPDLQDFWSIKGVNTPERVSEDGIIEEILRARRGEEEESDNEDDEKRERREENTVRTFTEIF